MHRPTSLVLVIDVRSTCPSSVGMAQAIEQASRPQSIRGRRRLASIGSLCALGRSSTGCRRRPCAQSWRSSSLPSRRACSPTGRRGAARPLCFGCVCGAACSWGPLYSGRSRGSPVARPKRAPCRSSGRKAIRIQGLGAHVRMHVRKLQSSGRQLPPARTVARITPMHPSSAPSCVLWASVVLGVVALILGASASVRSAIAADQPLRFAILAAWCSPSLFADR